MKKHLLRAPMAAVFHRPGGQKEQATLPAGAWVDESSRHSSTLEGKVGIYWEGRHYSVSLKDLLMHSRI